MKAILISLAIASLAGAANAQAASAADILAQAIVATPRTTVASPAKGSALDLSRPQAGSRYASALPAGIAKTSIDHRFDDDDAVGSLGYLCGLNPGQKMSGAAGAAGYDPMGKFLGAKLSFAFR
jgi:opacity protein-like surface antigen